MLTINLCLTSYVHARAHLADALKGAWPCLALPHLALHCLAAAMATAVAAVWFGLFSQIGNVSGGTVHTILDNSIG